jgi:hypothetical protein
MISRKTGTGSLPHSDPETSLGTDYEEYVGESAAGIDNTTPCRSVRSGIMSGVCVCIQDKARMATKYRIRFDVSCSSLTTWYTPSTNAYPFISFLALLKSSNQVPHIADFLGTNRKHCDWGRISTEPINYKFFLLCRKPHLKPDVPPN